MTIYTLNPTFSEFINIKIDKNLSTFNTFLVDSQADISIIKESALNDSLEIGTSKINIKGVTEESVPTLGRVTLQLNLDYLEIKHEFHIVPDTFDIPTDGIIGKDFCKTYRCGICYDNMIFTIRTDLGEIELELKSGLADNEIILPPRSEIFRLVKVKTSSFPAFIRSTEIEDGVYMANTIVHEKNATVRIVNTTNEIRRLRKLKVTTEDIENYNIYKINETMKDNTRTERVLDILTVNFCSPG